MYNFKIIFTNALIFKSKSNDKIDLSRQNLLKFIDVI